MWAEMLKSLSAQQTGNMKKWRFCVPLYKRIRQNYSELIQRERRLRQGVENVKIEYWKKAAEVLVASGGRQRDWDKIRKKWVDMASKATSYHQEFSKTGE